MSKRNKPISDSESLQLSARLLIDDYIAEMERRDTQAALANVNSALQARLTSHNAAQSIRS